MTVDRVEDEGHHHADDRAGEERHEDHLLLYINFYTRPREGAGVEAVLLLEVGAEVGGRT